MTEGQTPGLPPERETARTGPSVIIISIIISRSLSRFLGWEGKLKQQRLIPAPSTIHRAYLRAGPTSLLPHADFLIKFDLMHIFVWVVTGFCMSQINSALMAVVEHKSSFVRWGLYRCCSTPMCPTNEPPTLFPPI